ncbi:MAG: hypothetical protein IKW70_00160 [Verrucomicrobia bacterium]|nr:hypothetical protein [Verrucomicrobiota bacterium]
MSGRSWFYLTLFNGSPPNATDYVDVDIADREIVGTEVTTTDAIQNAVDLLDSFDSQISRADTFGVDIILTTEVIWRVN